MLALTSSVLIGTSFIITKKGLLRSKNSGAGEGHDYLTNYLWWLGMVVMICGELANFIAYSFAPAILVTPLGALSVIIGAVLASVFLSDSLGRDGIMGCTLSILGSVIIILHAPEEKLVGSIEEMLGYAVKPGFLTYSLLVIVITLVLIFHYGPRIGKKNPLVYVTICSLVGSITVIGSKALGIAIRLTAMGDNQFIFFSTYFFLILVTVCIVVQMQYFNKALDLFSTSIITPIYYVFFTTATIAANIILFQGIDDSSAKDIISIFCGFLSIFLGVFLLNTPKDPFRESLSKRGSFYGGTILQNFDEANLGFSGLDDDEFGSP